MQELEPKKETYSSKINLSLEIIYSQKRAEQKMQYTSLN